MRMPNTNDMDCLSFSEDPLVLGVQEWLVETHLHTTTDDGLYFLCITKKALILHTRIGGQGLHPLVTMPFSNIRTWEVSFSAIISLFIHPYTYPVGLSHSLELHLNPVFYHNWIWYIMFMFEFRTQLLIHTQVHGTKITMM